MKFRPNRVTILAIAMAANITLLGLSMALPRSEDRQSETAPSVAMKPLYPAAVAREKEPITPDKNANVSLPEQTAADEHLVGSYERMDPETASRVLLLLVERDTGVAIQVLQSLTVDRTAEVLERIAAQSPEAAADLSMAILRGPTR